MLSRLGIPLRDLNGPPRPVTMPPINLPDLDTEAIETEAREAAAKIKTIRLGRTAWEQISKSASFESYLAIGFALMVGKAHALRVSRANAAWGRGYSREFGIWMKRFGFAAIPKSTRSMAIELAENIEAIEAWRSTLPEKQRRRLVHPLSNVARWKAATAPNGKSPQDLRRDAKAALTHFRSCVMALPADEARVLWRLIAAEATVHISQHSYTKGSSSRPAAGSG